MESYRMMPDLASGFCGFHHTLDSALEILSDLNIPASRVNLRMNGKGYPTRWVVAQKPGPGEPLHPGASIDLSIAGLGYFHALPVGMWDRGNESELGTQEIVELLDDPLQKAGHWVRDGARLFDVRSDNPAACERWIRLFGISPDDWPVESWFKLALLLPNLHSLAGTQPGIQFVLHLMLELPLKEIRSSASFRSMQERDLSRLAVCYHRLGVDCIVGDRKEELAKLTLVLGPVSLETYAEFKNEARRRLLDSTLDLVLSCYQRYAISWLVEDVERPPVLSYPQRNAVLGINTHLGRSRWEEPVKQEEALEALR